MTYDKRSPDPNKSSKFRPKSAPRCESWFGALRCQLDEGHGDRDVLHVAAPLREDPYAKTPPVRWSDEEAEER